MKAISLVSCFVAISVLAPAQSVSSGFVPVCAPGEVFRPIPNASGGNDSGRLVDTTNVFTAAYVKDFAIDGDVTKPAWRNAGRVEPLLPMKGREFGYATEIKLLYSDTALYIGATFHQPMAELLAKYDQDDQPVWNDDCLEVLFLVPSGKGENMLHIAINALGSCWDAVNERPVWNVRRREIKVKRFDDRWTLEAKFPFAGLRIERPLPGDFIGARFCRVVHAPKHERAYMPVLKQSGISQRRMFGKLVFGDPGDSGVAEAVRAYRERVTGERIAKRLAGAKRMAASLEAGAMQFPNLEHPAFSDAGIAIHQMKEGVEKFEKGLLSTNDFLALDAGFRKYAGAHAYVAWTASPWETGSPDRVPPEKCAELPSLKFEQAGNEREAVCLEFTGLMCGPSIDLRLVPQSIYEPGKKRFVSCDSFEIYEEPFILFEKEVITAPLMRNAGNVITLVPGRTTRVWIVFNSRGVKPGDYRTRILLKPAYDSDVAEKSIEVAMKVWNFTLPETRDWPLQTFFWGPNFFDNDEVQMLKTMHDYHVTHGWTKSQLYTFGIQHDCHVVRRARKDDPVFFDRHLAETANEEFFRTAKSLGMRFVFGWGFPDRTPEWLRLMDQRLRGMGFAPGDYVFKGLIRDEFSKAQIPLNAERRAAVTRELGTNLWFQCVYLSTPPPTGATMDDIEAAHLPEFYKMFTVIESVFRDPVRGPDVTRRLRAKGCKVWTYKCSRYMQTQDVLGYYRFYLWRAYMRGMDGVAIWTSGGRSGDDGWDTRDGYDDGALWCGNNKTHVPTKRFEAFREGLEDVAYMDLLAKAIVAANGRDARDVPAAALAEAKALLAAREDVVKSSDQKAVDAWRLAAGRAIDALSTGKFTCQPTTGTK